VAAIAKYNHRHCYVALCALILWAIGGQAQAGLDDAYNVAAFDLTRRTPAEQLFAVYLWLGDVAENDRPAFIKTLSGHINGLSRDAFISFPQLVTKDLSVIRLDFSKYAWDFKVVKQLVAADPYYPRRLEITIVWPGGIWPDDGKRYDAGSFTVKRVVPVVSARWFVWQTAIAADRQPGYYDFLALRDRADFDKLVGFNAQVFKDARRSEYLEAVAFSGVSQQPRRIGIFPAVEARKYITFDAKLAVADKNPLRILDDSFKHDAEEIFGFLPNGMWCWFLADAAGKRQDSAPDFIGPDKTSPSNDGRIHVNLSCLRCHYNKGFSGSRGIIDFEQHFRTLFAKVPLTSPDYEKLQDIYRLYFRSFKQALGLDRLKHADAVMTATGVDADLWAKQIATIFEQYDAGATAAEAAIFLGCDEKTLLQALQDYARGTGQLDSVLGLFLVGKRIPRVQYHEVYPVLVDVIRKVHHAKVPADVRSLLCDPAAGAGERLVVPERNAVDLQRPQPEPPRSSGIRNPALQSRLSGHLGRLAVAARRSPAIAPGGRTDEQSSWSPRPGTASCRGAPAALCLLPQRSQRQEGLHAL